MYQSINLLIQFFKRNNNESDKKYLLWYEDYLIETENLFIDNLVVPIYWFKIIILKNTLFSIQMKGNMKYFGYWAFILIQKFKGNEEIRKMKILLINWIDIDQFGVTTK